VAAAGSAAPGRSPDTGIPLSRVVAVVAELPNGREQVGSGYLVAGRLVFTAAHCTWDKTTGAAALGLQVIRANDGAPARVEDVVAASAMDVAVLRLRDELGESDLPAPVFARVDRTRSGILHDCSAIGYPLFQRDPTQRARRTGELHGIIYRTDEAEASRLLLREPLLSPITERDLGSEADAGERGSAWGGLSGALVFHGSLALGVIVEHHPRQGNASVQVVAVDAIRERAKTDEATRRVADTLMLPPVDQLPWAATPSIESVVGLVEVPDPSGALLRPEPSLVRGSFREPVSMHENIFVSDESSPNLHLSRAALLREENCIVDFMGRDPRHLFLRDWCSSERLIDCLVITGPAGQGKTRLARQLIKEKKEDRWQASWLRRDGPEILVDVSILTALSAPTLIVIDYAETRSAQLDRVLGRISSFQVQYPLRIVMIARSAERDHGWWRRLHSVHRAVLDSAETLTLPSLPKSDSYRRQAFKVACDCFARRLAEVDPSIPWEEKVTEIAIPAGLNSSTYDTPLAIHLTALIALLVYDRPPCDETSFHASRDARAPEDELLDHELRYWEKHASSIGLDKRGVDDDTLGDMVVAATLLGAATEDEALGTLEVVPGLGTDDKTVLLADRFIRELFGQGDTSLPGSYWGSLQPDRLGEWHIGRRARHNSRLIKRLLGVASEYQMDRAGEILRRAVLHQPHLADALTMISVRKTKPESEIGVSAQHRDEHDHYLSPTLGRPFEPLRDNPVPSLRTNRSNWTEDLR